jgi:hypothetical protein
VKGPQVTLTLGTWRARAWVAPFFHFLTDPKDRNRYRHLDLGGYLILAAFAEDGPEQCSGLLVSRYGALCRSRARWGMRAYLGVRLGGGDLLVRACPSLFSS